MSMTEVDTRWGMVVESDHVWSDKTCKWYPVRETVLLPDGVTVKIWFDGITKAVQRPASGQVKVRRGETGRVVDMFAVLFSGPTSRKLS